jgi:hypothetical protein
LTGKYVAHLGENEMIQFVIGLIIGMAVTIFAMALTNIGDDDK